MRPINEPNFIEQIEQRICELQKTHLSLQEQFQRSQHDFERNLDHSALQIIDVLDMIETTKLNLNIEGEANSNARLIVKKIEQRLNNILRYWQVQEIVFKDGQIEAGKTRVLETQKVSDAIPAGTIVKICRKGYLRGAKTIRPADVITASRASADLK